ncbi:hypothetical protein R5R35_001481 [Gryllus longicercus]|uniref:CCHC-type domain-containing protein n=1 Tax=Gryllus longicercus TaxID=2509291 RepID=A0AAN9Z3S7_9ORTH
MAERLDMNSLSKFDGSNYNQWRFQMNCALRAKGLYEIVHGTELKPENNNETQKAWIKNDATAMFILTSALDYAQITLIENCESSHQIIDKLDSIYLQRSESSKMIAHERFHQYRMKDSDSVAQHIANVENLAKKLKDIGETVSDAAIMTKIISTLPQKFLNFRQAWLSVSEDRQKLRNLTSRLVDEEANLSLVEQIETAFTVSSGKNQSAKSKRSTKQREPSSSGSSKQKSVDQNQEVKQDIKCYQCGKRGHIARFCRNKPKHKSSHRDKEYTSFNVEFPEGVNMENTWIMNSGASAHMSYRAELFSNMSAVSEGTTVVIGNNVSLPVIGKGDIEIEKKIKGEWYKSVITNVLFVPDLRRNLFSEAVATKKGWTIMKEGKKAEILHGSKLIASAILDDNNNYRMLFRNISVHQAQQVTENSLKAWHDRLGHVNFTRVREMIKSGVISGITLSDEDEILCESCLYGKQHRFHHASREVREEEVGERVFTDVCGPIATESSGGRNQIVDLGGASKLAAPEAQRPAIRNLAVNETEPRQDLDGEQFDANPRNVEALQEDEGTVVDNARDYNLRNRDKLKRPGRYTANFAMVNVPLTYKEAMEGSESREWSKAIAEELSALKRNDTWQLVKRTDSMKVIGSKWVFSVKDQTSNKPRFKARLCAKGFSQEKGVDYDEIFSPTTRYESIRILLATAVKNNYKILQFDVRTAFLYGDLHETIYMDPPEGANISDGQVCRLQKSLYGLKQTSRCWNEKFNQFMLDQGFRRGEADKCVYRKSCSKSTIILILYVDDGLVMSSDEASLYSFLDELVKQFEITVMEPGHFVGMEILDETDEDNNRRILIHQSSYIRRMIEKFHMQDAAPVGTPADPHVRLKKPEYDDHSEDSYPYREAVGSLMFAAIVTRPDIMFATNQISRYTSNNDQTHWNAVKRILKYLKGTINFGIEYRRNSEMLVVTGYSDSDFGNDFDTRRSMSGYVFLLSNGAVTWSSQTQKAVTLSTTEAEYVAASEATKEVTWIRQFLDDIGEPVQEPTNLKMDNQGALCLVKNPVFHKRTKHVDIKYYIREKLEEGTISVSFVPSDRELADVFTKPTPRDHFHKLIFNLGMRKC